MDRLAEPIPLDARATAGRADTILRQRAVLAMLRADGFVSVEALAMHFGISRMTARRDLQRLVASGLARRMHGGAVPTETMDLEPSFAARQLENRNAKRAIARAAAALVRPGDSIGIDVGSTTLEFARALLGHRKLNVFTNSLRVAMLLADSKISTYLPGGQVRGEEMSVVGSLTVSHLQNFRLNTVFLGVSGVTVDGIFDFSLEDVEVKRVYLRCAARTVVLADASKFDRHSAVRIQGLKGVATLVTDRPPAGPLAAALKAANVDVIIAGHAADAAAA